MQSYIIDAYAILVENGIYALDANDNPNKLPIVDSAYSVKVAQQIIADNAANSTGVSK